MKQHLTERLRQCFQKQEQFTLKEAYHQIPDTPKESIRARIYENLNTQFEKISRGIYKIKNIEANCILLEGDGRNLSFLQDQSVDCIITDHPWQDIVSNKGGNRNFSEYECFQYNEEDFKEKARVLKEGSFLVEILPEENSSNYQYLYQLKQMATSAGFLYYSKVPWKKGRFISNTGRKSKNSQDIMIFTKGKARNLRFDTKKSFREGIACYMSGTDGMLPTCFDVEPVKREEKIHQSELPCSLIEQIIQYVTREGEVILDQFAGSGVVGEASLKQKRSCILIEKVTEYVERIQHRLAKLNATCLA